MINIKDQIREIDNVIEKNENAIASKLEEIKNLKEANKEIAKTKKKLEDIANSIDALFGKVQNEEISE